MSDVVETARAKTAPVTSTATGAPPEVQRRILAILFASQLLSGAGLAAGLTVGALLAQDMLGGTGFAGLPNALSTAGSALAAVAVGRLSHARGRRPGLAAGYLAGALGSAGVLVAAITGTAVLLFVSLFVYGAGTATNLQSRYAGADLAAPEHRARALSTVLVATTVGGVVGPNLAAPTGGLARVLGIPTLAGPFLLAGAAYALAALVLTLWLRPDPLLMARALERDPVRDGGTPAAQPERGLALGALTMVLTQLVMVAIMTMTPVHLHDHGHGTAAAGLVIAIHVGAMYLPSPLTGWLVDRYGRSSIAVAAGVALLAAGVIAAAVPGDSVALLALALALLGLGWNFGLVSGTAAITDALHPATRARTQGLVDVAVGIAGAGGGAASGVVVSAAGYPVLALAGGVLSLAILPVVAVTARGRRQPPTPGTAR
ncbi:MFS family permease [Amycolatopsis endophytica]|uniref:MFS family permease n=1 Tax=Amycolatopsis endophytica TaxID=860233 RepID=A0A853BG73_9PSEU|nr:MFS transporter [Amycolatopsis endophytica]NYI93631.1 MFS family permease [Amycolatopsis endophytica]